MMTAGAMRAAASESKPEH